MTASPDSSATRRIERGIRYGLVAVLLVGLRRRDLPAVTNAFGGLLASFLPGVIEYRYEIALRPWQRLYITSATLTHAVGMLGPYEDVWWWDHLTHTHSASILASLVHAHARHRGRDPRPRVVAAVTILGVLWEGAEYVIHRVARLLHVEPILVPYGKRDTLLDLCFNLLGATLVLVFGDRLLGNVTPGTDGLDA